MNTFFCLEKASAIVGSRSVSWAWLLLRPRLLQVFSLFSSAGIAPLTMTSLGRSSVGFDKLSHSVHRGLLITALLCSVSGGSANYYSMAVGDNAQMNDVQGKCHQNTAHSDSEHVFY